jgi:hypothetical protein
VDAPVTENDVVWSSHLAESEEREVFAWRRGPAAKADRRHPGIGQRSGRRDALLVIAGLFPKGRGVLSS